MDADRSSLVSHLLDPERVKNLRLERAWSQEQLAELSGLSLRTIQRIEKRGKASMESKKTLAAGHELLFEAPDELLMELLARFGGN